MYLVYLQLCDDSITTKDFNKIVKVEKLQSFDAQILKLSEDAPEREWLSAVTYVPEKGARFELHYHYCKTVSDMVNDDIIASAIFSCAQDALQMAEFFESIKSLSSFAQIGESHFFSKGYMQFIACHNL